MPQFPSALNVKSDEFRGNTERMMQRVEEVRGLHTRIRAASASRKGAFDKRGQLLPRERVARLLDRDAPFLEMWTLAGLNMHDDDGGESIQGGGGISGIGTVSGKRVLILANDSAIKGGTISPMGLRKTLRAQEVARQNKLPVMYLVESGGANLMYQSELFVDGGRSFANQARLSAAGIPQVAIVHGSSTAGGAYLPGLSDHVVLVRGQSKVFLAGPPLVKAAMGEDATDEELGGSDVHGRVTGLGEHVAEDDAHAVALGREILDKLNWDLAQPVGTRAAAMHDAQELLGVVPADDRTPYDSREIMVRIVDGADLLDFKPSYAPEMVCVNARVDGQLVGILGNNGPIQPAGSTKAAQFIQLCDQTRTPLVFIQNTTGYMVGTVAERNGAIKHGAKMIQAVANARVPRFTFVVGGSYGAGNYGMCGRGFDPNFIFAWPNARVGVMGGVQAAKVMEIITRAKFARMGQVVEDEVIQSMASAIAEQLDKESTALFSTARLWDDGIIDPRDTRAVLSLCLAITREAEQRTLQPNAFGVARF